MVAVGGSDRRFFVAGGTLSASAESYIERAADASLLEALRAGRFAYVLNSRQMGKSSLCVRTMNRLESLGVWTTFVDLTKIGGKNASPEQWYAGIALEVGRSELRPEMLTYWKKHAHLSPMQRFFGCLREIVLERTNQPVAVFFDEIDATRSLSFSADEFFAGIRECYNRRAQDPAYERLTFCLLGVAVPSDLINNPTSTPFNVGERIYLKDFTLSEALQFATGLGGDRDGRALVERIYYWTNGHPYLTQSLCSAIAVDSAIKTKGDVDKLVRRDLFDPNARETNINLADVANRALHAGDLEPEPEKFRADLLSAYEEAWKRKPLLDDESNRVAALLKLSGIMRSEGNQLHVRNRIYQHVFDRAWVRENMPGQELRRQHRAFWLGVARTTALSIVVLMAIGYLAWNNARLARIAEAQRNQALYDTYLASMRSLPASYAQNNLSAINQTLDSLQSNPERGWEWSMWRRRSNRASRWIIVPGDGATSERVSPDKTKIALNRWSKLWVIELATGRTLATYDLSKRLRAASQVRWCGNRYLAEFNLKGDTAVIDLANGSVDVHLGLGFTPAWSGDPAPDSGGVMFGWGKHSEPAIFTIPGGKIRFLPKTPPPGYETGSISPDAKFAAWESGENKEDWIVLYDLNALKESRRIPCRFLFGWPIWMPGRQGLLFVSSYGQVAYLDCYDPLTGRPLWQTRLAAGNLKQPPSFSKDGKFMTLSTTTGQALILSVQPSGLRMLRTIREASFSDFDPEGDPVIFSREIDIYRRPEKLAESTWDYGLLSAVDISREGIVRSLDGKRAYQIDTRASPLRATPIPGFKHGMYLDGEGVGFVTVQANTIDVIDPNLGNGRLTLQTPSRLISEGIRTPGGEKTIPQGFDWSISDDRSMMALVSGSSPSPVIAIYKLPANTADTILTCMGAVEAYAFSPKGDLFGACDDSGFLSVWQTTDWKCVLSVQIGSNYAMRVAFSPDGKKLCLAGTDTCGYVVDMASKRVCAVLRGHSQRLNCVCWSPDGKRIVTGSADKTIRIWDSVTGDEIGILGLQRSGPDYLKFTNSGKDLVSISFDGNELTVWKT